MKRYCDGSEAAIWIYLHYSFRFTALIQNTHFRDLPRKLNATTPDENIQISEDLLATRERIDHKKLPNIGITKLEQKQKVSIAEAQRERSV